VPSLPDSVPSSAFAASNPPHVAYSPSCIANRDVDGCVLDDRVQGGELAYPDIAKTSCMRDSLLYGIGSGLPVGTLSFLHTSTYRSTSAA
jgi:hypothetical protein